MRKETSQTLDRGLAILALLAEGRQLTPAQIAKELNLSRPIVYRLLNTLSQRRLVTNTDDGAYRPGSGLTGLSRSVASDLRAAAAPQMSRLAEELGATTILDIAEGDEAVCVATVEPTGPHIGLRYPPGFRHPLYLTASGMAILAGRQAVDGERAEIADARRRGYAVSYGDIQTIPGVGVAAAIVVDGRPADASVAIASLDSGGLDEQHAGALVIEAARLIANELG